MWLLFILSIVVIVAIVVALWRTKRPPPVRWLGGRRRRFAKAAGNHRTGLKSMISGQFFSGTSG
jgi:hypothetical protein